MIQTVKEYISSGRISFPLECGDHKPINGLKTKCYECKRENIALRGKVVDFGRGVELDAASLCLKCRLVTPFVYRRYDDGAEYLNVAGRELEIKPRPRFSLAAWLKKIFS